jgi:leucyl/phenylalanyl-tRNA---protein transferase
MVYGLDDNTLWLPNPTHADEDGLLAIGGNLSTQMLLLAYQNGIFPWYNLGEPICWYSPHQRFVIVPNEIKISKSMRQLINAKAFTITFNTAFLNVIKACAHTKRNGETGTWINTDMQTAYHQLHQQGYAHSVEVWQNNQLVGGLYGVQINQVFCGESMFSSVSNASKMALIWLCIDRLPITHLTFTNYGRPLNKQGGVYGLFLKHILGVTHKGRTHPLQSFCLYLTKSRPAGW